MKFSVFFTYFVFIWECICGLGVDIPVAISDSTVQLTVTKNFNDKLIDGEVLIDNNTTVVQALKARTDVETSFGDAFVNRIAHFPSNRDADGYWFYYVNGILADDAANSLKLRARDIVWWDFHHYSTQSNSALVIGSFPEPFRSGGPSRNLPTKLFCETELCSEVTKLASVLSDKGVRNFTQYSLSPRSNIDNSALHIAVGKWSALLSNPIIADIASHPLPLGLFVHMEGNGAITTLNRDGLKTQTWEKGGFIAATGTTMGSPIVWLISGTDREWTMKALSLVAEYPENIANRSQVILHEGGLVNTPHEMAETVKSLEK